MVKFTFFLKTANGDIHFFDLSYKGQIILVRKANPAHTRMYRRSKLHIFAVFERVSALSSFVTSRLWSSFGHSHFLTLLHFRHGIAVFGVSSILRGCFGAVKLFFCFDHIDLQFSHVLVFHPWTIACWLATSWSKSSRQNGLTPWTTTFWRRVLTARLKKSNLIGMSTVCSLLC